MPGRGLLNTMKITNKDASAADECPKCGAMSYRGGYCFKCGTYRPAKRAETVDVEGLDVVDFMKRTFGTRLSDRETTEEQLDEMLEALESYRKHSQRKKPRNRGSVTITDNNTSQAVLLVQAVIQPYGSTAEGQLVRALQIPWRRIIRYLDNDWTRASQLEPRFWEQIVAAAFDEEGYDEVTLTPRSGDRGRDVIATRKGVGCIRIIDSVKAYKPGHLVRHDDVRALAGVLSGDPKASKGILTTTSDFAPGIASDPLLAPFIPYRIELMNGAKLREWLSRLAK
jgi:restriction system protein